MGMLALICVFVFGTFTILVSLFLHQLVSFISSVFKYNLYPLLAWTTNGVLQLQRLAHEELDLGHWAATDEPIPFTLDSALLGLLDISDKTHPRLKYPGERRREGSGSG
ncbi:hypothetical protein SLS62_009243 [Diatrype stigma]|uniref:Uncharacterized protein n=1 Tax=Diatrype stigma TaxID=117547 RepID=A0AAN9UHX6_9PEZI